MVSKVRFRGEQGRVAITHDMEHEILDPTFYIQNTLLFMLRQFQEFSFLQRYFIAKFEICISSD